MAGALVYSKFVDPKEKIGATGLCYSFDMLIPIVKLDERNGKVELTGPAKYYFYIHKLVGWMLGSFLLAAVAGLNPLK